MHFLTITISKPYENHFGYDTHGGYYGKVYDRTDFPSFYPVLTSAGRASKFSLTRSAYLLDRGHILVLNICEYLSFVKMAGLISKQKHNP